MNKKWIRSLALSGLLSFLISHNVIAMEESGEDLWNKAIHTQVPLGRKQLEKYKEIYGKEPVEGLEVPLCWAYANAYDRLAELEKNDSTIGENLGEAPTVALRHLFDIHAQDSSQSPSTKEFEAKALDVVELLDLYFHPGEVNLRKNKLQDIFEKRNKVLTNSFFSPVFLKKQGIGMESINYAFFGPGPLLAVTVVGPNRMAHEELYSQTNFKFIQEHDLNHAASIKKLVEEQPGLFSAFRKLYGKIKNVEAVTDQNYLHMGLFLFGHEFPEAFEKSSIDASPSNFKGAVNDALAVIRENIRSGYYNLNDEHNYVVLYKDALVGMAQVMEKGASNSSEQMLYKAYPGNFKKEKRKDASSSFIPRFLTAFEKKFWGAAEPLINEIDQAQTEEKDNAE